MLDFITSGYVLTGFLFLIGGIHVWLAGQIRGSDDQSRSLVRRATQAKGLIVLFGLLYVGLGLVFLLTTYGNSLFLTYQAPCENLINWTNETPMGASETDVFYYYYDSCAEREIPVTVERLYTILGWVVALEIIFASFAFFLYIIHWWLKW